MEWDRGGKRVKGGRGLKEGGHYCMLVAIGNM